MLSVAPLLNLPWARENRLSESFPAQSALFLLAFFVCVYYSGPLGSYRKTIGSPRVRPVSRLGSGRSETHTFRPRLGRPATYFIEEGVSLLVPGPILGGLSHCRRGREAIKAAPVALWAVTHPSGLPLLCISGPFTEEEGLTTAHSFLISGLVSGGR